MRRKHGFDVEAARRAAPSRSGPLEGAERSVRGLTEMVRLRERAALTPAERAGLAALRAAVAELELAAEPAA
jgi:hypothetical protein